MEEPAGSSGNGGGGHGGYGCGQEDGLSLMDPLLNPPPSAALSSACFATDSDVASALAEATHDARDTKPQAADAEEAFSSALELAPAGGKVEEVLLQIRQRRSSNSRQQTFEVQNAPDGGQEIPMTVNATTVGSWIPRDVVLRSSFLARCLQSPMGTAVSRTLDCDEDDVEDPLGLEDGEAAHNAVVCRRIAEAVLEVGLPSLGAGQKLLTPGTLSECLDISSPSAPPFDAASASITQLLALFLWAVVLDLGEKMGTFREAIIRAVDVSTVALVMAAGTATGDEDILRACYWCVREAMCGATGAPASWLNGAGAVRLIKGALCYKTICRTPLRALSGALSADMSSKRERWQTPVNCYTLCQVHRLRGEGGSYPHTYEMRLDHSNEVVMTALREDEQSPCRIFAGDAASEDRSEHCQEYLGAVVANFWGTLFTIYDSGADVKSLTQNVPAAKDLPLRDRTALCKIGYETNILGNCPRKVTVDFDRGGTSWHMENLQPRWDKKLNSYALPFFGRVKKASAKNFQLVVNSDINTIYLMFGKISKDVFCLDYRGPISALEAMGIACAALAKKRAVS